MQFFYINNFLLSKEEMDMKKKITVLVAGVVAAAAVVTTNAAISFNGVTVADENATVVDGVAMVPFRAVMEGLGTDVAWDAETKTATAAAEGDVAEVTVGSNKLTVNGIAVDMEAAAQIVDEKVYIPVSIVTEGTQTSVDIDEDGNVAFTSADYVASGAAVDAVVSEEAVDVAEEETEETTEAVETVEEATEETTETAVVEVEVTEGDEDAAVEE
jgi:hypothetical protein